jgi:hypothetical protein
MKKPVKQVAPNPRYKFASGGGAPPGEAWQWHGGLVIGKARWPGYATVRFDDGETLAVEMTTANANAAWRIHVGGVPVDPPPGPHRVAHRAAQRPRKSSPRPAPQPAPPAPAEAGAAGAAAGAAAAPAPETGSRGRQKHLPLFGV